MIIINGYFNPGTVFTTVAILFADIISNKLQSPDKMATILPELKYPMGGVPMCSQKWGDSCEAEGQVKKGTTLNLFLAPSLMTKLLVSILF